MKRETVSLFINCTCALNDTSACRRVLCRLSGHSSRHTFRDLPECVSVASRSQRRIGVINRFSSTRRTVKCQRFIAGQECGRQTLWAQESKSHHLVTSRTRHTADCHSIAIRWGTFERIIQQSLAPMRCQEKQMQSSVTTTNKIPPLVTPSAPQETMASALMPQPNWNASQDFFVPRTRPHLPKQKEVTNLVPRSSWLRTSRNNAVPTLPQVPSTKAHPFPSYLDICGSKVGGLNKQSYRIKPGQIALENIFKRWFVVIAFPEFNFSENIWRHQTNTKRMRKSGPCSLQFEPRSLACKNPGHRTCVNTNMSEHQRVKRASLKYWAHSDETFLSFRKTACRKPKLSCSACSVIWSESHELNPVHWDSGAVVKSGNLYNAHARSRSKSEEITPSGGRTSALSVGPRVGDSRCAVRLEFVFELHDSVLQLDVFTNIWNEQLHLWKKRRANRKGTETVTDVLCENFATFRAWFYHLLW